jgi:alkanesulfonate monooxygenase SsuD/methylene tetrahydromethanopterin reductase-like flavin-dependent oxidoreductase (luciferase family)
MRIGLTLPTFRDDASAVEAAKEAELLGFDGVFAFDHFWPMGQPQRPALSAMPLLGAVAAVTDKIAVGSLVARIGLLPDELLVDSVLSLDRIANGRFIAGLGVGDSKSAEENIAFGIEYAHASVRLNSLEWCAERLLEEQVEVWIGGGSNPNSKAAAVAEKIGVALNIWEATTDGVKAVRRQWHNEVTWAGMAGRTPGAPTEPTVDSVAGHLASIRDAGATWAVCIWPPNFTSTGMLAEAADVVRGGSTIP